MNRNGEIGGIGFVGFNHGFSRKATLTTRGTAWSDPSLAVCVSKFDLRFLTGEADNRSSTANANHEFRSQEIRERKHSLKSDKADWLLHRSA
jgi:hypothetical protein